MVKFHNDDAKCTCKDEGEANAVSVIHNKNCKKFKTFEEEWKIQLPDVENPNLKDRIICCCKLAKCESHNESIKYKIDFADDSAKDKVLFPVRELGDLENYEDLNNDKMVIPRYNQQKNLDDLHGRNVLLYELIKYLTSKETNDKIVNLSGPLNSGRFQIGIFAMNYCMDRKFFTDGCMAINCHNFKTCEELHKEISHHNKIMVLSGEEDDIIDKIKDMNIAIMFYGCNTILNQPEEQEKFYKFLRKIAEQTQNIKVIFFMRDTHKNEKMDYRVKQSTKIIKISPITNEEAAELFFNLNVKNDGFKKTDAGFFYEN